MNRAERRREQKAREKVHVMTRDDMMYDKGFRAGMVEGIRTEAGQGARMMTTCIATILNREFGFGARRLDKALSHMNYMLETFQGHTEREEEARKWILKKTGLDLDDYTGARILELRDEMQKEYDKGKIIKRGASNEDGYGVGFNFVSDDNRVPAGDEPVGDLLPGIKSLLDHVRRDGR